MQLGHKFRYLAEWACTITCGFLLFCDTLQLRSYIFFYQNSRLSSPNFLCPAITNITNGIPLPSTLCQPETELF